jgi:iron complex transport system substrate-binding protein
VSIGGALTEIVYALGAQSQLVAVDTTSLHPKEALLLPKVGYMRQLSAEGVLSMRPSVVLATAEAGPPNVIAQLKSANVNLQIASAEHSAAELQNKVNMVATALGKPEEGKLLAQRLAREMQDVQTWVAQQKDAPRVLFLLAHSGTPQVSGEGTAADALIRLAGGMNVMAGLKGYKPMTAEAMVAAAPEVILISQQGLEAMGGVDKLLANAGLALTPAGKNRRVIAMEALYMLGFGPRLPQAVRDLARQLRS